MEDTDMEAMDTDSEVTGDMEDIIPTTLAGTGVTIPMEDMVIPKYLFQPK